MADAAEVRVRAARWPQDTAALRMLRRRVFIEEQSVPETLEWDGRDAECHHAIAELVDGTPLGTGRLLPAGADGRAQIGRMAVLPEYRNRGIGRRLLLVLLDAAQARGDAAVHLHAQLDAMTFYTREGFVAEGDIFVEAGIEHRSMCLSLD